MAITLLGQNDDVVRMGPLRFWAERGLIHIEDATDNSYKTETVKEMLLRAQALQDMLTKSSDDSKLMYYDEAVKIQRQIEDIAAVCKKAQEQGEPHDASMRRAAVRSLPISINVPCNMEKKYDAKGSTSL